MTNKNNSAHLRFLILLALATVGTCALLYPHAADAACAASSGNTLQNPTCFGNISEFIQGVLKAVVAVGLPIITLFMVYAGFLYVKAQGKPDQILNAHRNFLYVIIGTILILGAWVLSTLIGGTITQLLG